MDRFLKPFHFYFELARILGFISYHFSEMLIFPTLGKCWPGMEVLSRFIGNDSSLLGISVKCICKKVICSQTLSEIVKTI